MGSDGDRQEAERKEGKGVKVRTSQQKNKKLKIDGGEVQIDINKLIIPSNMLQNKGKNYGWIL